MPFFEKGDVKISYEKWPGDTGKPWVTLINGYARPYSDLKALGRYLSDRGFAALTLDNRGAGNAECPPAFSIEEMAEDVRDLWAHLGCTKSILLGMGIGGVIATEVAYQFPQSVAGLILLATPLSAKDASKNLKAPPHNPRRLEGELARYFSPEFIARERIVVQGFMRQMGKIFQEPDTALGAAAQRAAFESFDLSSKLEKITSPALTVHGEKDLLIPAESSQKIASLIRGGGRFHLFESAGHLLIVEKSVELYDVIFQFCQMHIPI